MIVVLIRSVILLIVFVLPLGKYEKPPYGKYSCSNFGGIRTKKMLKFFV